MVDIIQYIINGCIGGSIYGLIAIAFIVIYRSTRIINFAQGEMVMVGGFMSWWFLVHTPLPAWVAVISAAVACALLGIVLERVALRPLIGQSVFTIVMVTIALILCLKGFTIMVWGAKQQVFPAVLGKVALAIGPFTLSTAVYGMVASVLLVLIFWWLFNRTRIGLTMSAVAEDHQVARSLAIDIKRSMTLAWAFSGAISVIAAVSWLSGGTITFIAAEIGLRALPCVLLAGLESIPGALIAGLLVGIGESLAYVYLDPLTQGGMSLVFPFIVMIIILLVRPEGLFGWKRIERL